MGFRRFVSSRLKFNSEIFDALESKCKNETTVGKCLNFLLFLLFRLARILKNGRIVYQRKIRDKVRRVRSRLSSQPAATYPTMAWDRPLPLSMRNSNSNMVLIIAELSIPQCKRYRVEQKADALKALGYEVEIVSFNDAEACTRLLPFALTVIFYRTPYWHTVKDFLHEAKRLHIPTFYDIDDLVFDLDEYKKHPVLQTLPKNQAEELLKGAQLYRDCLAACDFGIASTSLLAEYFRTAMKGKVYVLENALDKLSLAASASSEKLRKDPNANIVIGYGSGTKSHDEDFQLAKDALIRIMSEFKNTVLAIHGYLDIGDEFSQFPGRVFRIPFLSAAQYLEAVARFDINLAPLVHGPFNDAKSNIKFLEASGCGVPTVASPRREFLQAIEHGKNGFLANSEDEWHQSIRSLVQSAELRKTMGENAKKSVIMDYSPSVTKEKMGSIIFDVLKPAHKPVTKQKLMFVNCLYSPFSFGGATLVVENLVRHLTTTYDVVVVTTNRMIGRPILSCLRYAENSAQVYSVRLQHAQTKAHSFDNPEFGDIFSRILDQEKPDIVHFHAIQMMGVEMLAAAKQKAKGLVVTMHDAWWLCERQFMADANEVFCGQTGTIDLKKCASCTGNADFTYRRFKSLTQALEPIDSILAPSAFHADLARANISNSTRVRVNRNGVLSPQASPTPRTRIGKPIRFGYVGGGKAKHKGYYFLKEVFENCAHSNYELIIADIHLKLGGSPLKEPLKWKVRGKVSIVEPYDSESMDSFFEGVDVLLFPSQVHESFGLTVREAILRNTWVIATKSGGVVDIIEEGKNGNLVDLHDTSAFRAKIETLLTASTPFNNYCSPGKEKISSYEMQAKELVSIYNEILNRHDSPKKQPSTETLGEYVESQPSH